MRRTTTLTAAGLLGLALLAPTTSATAAAETCRGEAATIVGTGPTITGTDARDVIVTGSAISVSTRGSDDVICVRGGTAAADFVNVDAGWDNDVVDTTAMGGVDRLSVVLGAGTDTFIGGAANETVVAGPDPRTGLDDSGADTVRTGEGDDQVTTGAVGGSSGSGANADVADLGPGDDQLTLLSWWTTPEALLTGGEGDDTLVTDMSGTRNEVVVNLTTGRLAATHGNPDVYEGDGLVSSFEAADVSISDQWVYYTGLAGDDSLTVHVDPSCCALPGLEVTSLAGDDEVMIDNTMIDAVSRIDTGEGDDRLVAARSNGFLDLDLKLERLVTSDPQNLGGGGVPRGFPTVVGVENAFLMAPQVSMVGDNGDNDLLANGCTSTLDGRHGDDYLSQVGGDPWFDTYTFDCAASAEMYGGPGKDRLRGGQGNDRLDGEGDADRIEGRGGNDRIRGAGGSDTMDGGDGRDDVRGQRGSDLLRGNEDGDTLLGGPGHDKADGSAGRDRCVAERERRCER